MIAPSPHYVLVSETDRDQQGTWRFALTSSDREELVASDREPEVQGERLELLTVVRGLEALEQPSSVTLITGSRYVARGFNQGLEEWRENDWCWERFGAMVEIKDRDLWQRVDHALEYHQVECLATSHLQTSLQDVVALEGEARLSEVVEPGAVEPSERPAAVSKSRIVRAARPAREADLSQPGRSWLADRAEAMRDWFAQGGSMWMPSPGVE